MTPTSYIEPLELGKRVMAVLRGGRRTATYKLATLSALIDYCEQHARLDDSGASIDVPIDDLAERVIGMYWRQVQPLPDGRSLHQSSESAKILGAVTKLRQAANAENPRRRCPSSQAAKHRTFPTYTKTIKVVWSVLLEQPLPRLQHVGSGPHTPDQSFLYDEDTIERESTFVPLKPGVGPGLAQLGAAPEASNPIPVGRYGLAQER